MWDVATNECKSELRGHDNVVECSVFAPIVSYPYIKELIGIDVRTHCYRQVLKYCFELNLSFFCFCSQPKVAAKDQPLPGQYVATGSRDKTIKLWDATGQCIHTLVGIRAYCSFLFGFLFTGFKSCLSFIDWA